MKILYVEDTPINVRMMERIASHLGHELIVATTGIDGLKLIQETVSLDLILLDIDLPGADGFRLTHQIRQLRPQVPIVAITAYAMSGDREKCLEAGASDYISKPYKFDTIADLCRRHDKETGQP